MSLRLEMLQVARLAPRLLRDSSELVRDFLLGELGKGGGFRGRDGEEDLYYTVFGIEGLLALQETPPAARIEPFIRSFGDGEGLDLVHLASLVRCDAGLGGKVIAGEDRTTIAARLASFRSRDGGYHNDPHAASGTVYGSFLAHGAYEDLGAAPPDARELGEFLAARRTPDGGYANDPRLSEGTTPATAAAATLLRTSGLPVDRRAGEWLLERSAPRGGFLAAPGAPFPDLLSTATALHALAGMEVSIESVKEPSLDFIDSLWTNRGGFYGHWADDALDCEYAYYGLLALGHLSL